MFFVFMLSLYFPCNWSLQMESSWKGKQERGQDCIHIGIAELLGIT
ncbi:hypothetical protein I7I48_05064 [Histoplasma ohiense]|nr:hypothetical protein I7I48_05064 [Histoplasma ohiense (nom. inval.)]